MLLRISIVLYRAVFRGTLGAPLLPRQNPGYGPGTIVQGEVGIQQNKKF
jgi:hypothetical protein